MRAGCPRSCEFTGLTTAPSPHSQPFLPVFPDDAHGEGIEAAVVEELSAEGLGVFGGGVVVEEGVVGEDGAGAVGDGETGVAFGEDLVGILALAVGVVFEKAGAFGEGIDGAASGPGGREGLLDAGLSLHGGMEVIELGQFLHIEEGAVFVEEGIDP